MSRANMTVQPGEWVAIQRENFVKVYKITAGALAMLGRDCLELENILGQPRWSTYYLQQKGKNNVRKFALELCGATEFEENVADSLIANEDVNGKDNRLIKDDGQSQRLSKQDIESMQSDGATAKDIIGQLVENSSTFEQKSLYSKEKYVNKKEKKYKRVIMVRPTNVPLILQALSGPGPLDGNKLLGLRIDSLAQIVYMSGVQSGAGFATYLLFESGTQGIITTAVLERLGTDEEAHLVVISPQRGTSKTLSLQAMNFSAVQLAKVHFVTLSGFLKKIQQEGLIKTDSSLEMGDSGIGTGLVPTENLSLEISPDDCKLASSDSTVLENDSETPNSKKIVHASEDLAGDTACLSETPMETDVQTNPRKNTLKRSAEDAIEKLPKRTFSTEESELCVIAERLKKSKADCLIIAGKEDPSELTTLLLPLVELSRPVVVYSQYREPLQQTYMMLKAMKNVTALRLSEPWLRKYQVLSDRTHPEVNMSGSGGFLLTGLTIGVDSSNGKE